MISQLTGKVSLKDPEFIILNVQGVGYKIYVTPDTLSKVPETSCTLWTYLVVRETALDLYGFLQQDDLNLFTLLLGVSGVGPKSALAFLALGNSEIMRSAIASNDINYLTKVSGIGKKSAQKIVLELKDKVGNVANHVGLQQDTDTIDALIAMGYTTQEARLALEETSGTLTPEEKIKQALKNLSSQ